MKINEFLLLMSMESNLTNLTTAVLGKEEERRNNFYSRAQADKCKRSCASSSKKKLILEMMDKGMMCKDKSKVEYYRVNRDIRTGIEYLKKKRFTHKFEDIEELQKKHNLQKK